MKLKITEKNKYGKKITIYNSLWNDFGEAIAEYLDYPDPDNIEVIDDTIPIEHQTCKIVKVEVVEE